MLYKNDINYFKPSTIYGLERSSKTNSIQNVRKREGSSAKVEITSIWKKYCECTPTHGLRYLADENIHKYERITWAIIIICCAIGTIYACILLSRRYQNSGLQTVVESTIYPVYYIVFPAVTICNYNRINWSKIQLAQQKFLPLNSSNETIELFRQFIGQFETFEFGKFNLFDKFENVSLKSLDHINLTAIMAFLSYECHEIFHINCFWKGNFYPCCRMFVHQRSEIGYCLTFNSMSNTDGQSKKVALKYYPWHVSKAGFHSALRVEIKLDRTNLSPYNINPTYGIAIVIHDSYRWPFRGEFLPENTNVSVIVEPKSTYASEDTKFINPDVRECIFEDQVKKSKYKTLPGLPYLKMNCIAQCHQYYTVKLCNCTLEMFFPKSNYTPCTASDFHCLAKNNDILCIDKTADEDQYVDTLGKGMLCPCLLECDSIDYMVAYFPLPMYNLDASSTNFSYVNIDVHYQRNTMMRYKTNVVYGWLDLMSAFGGLAGLFLGCSLFSGAELLYYLSIGWIISLTYKPKQIPNSDLKKIQVTPVQNIPETNKTRNIWQKH